MKIGYSIIQTQESVVWTLAILPDGVSWAAPASTKEHARATMARMVRAWRKAGRAWRNR